MIRLEAVSKSKGTLGDPLLAMSYAQWQVWRIAQRQRKHRRPAALTVKTETPQPADSSHAGFFSDNNRSKMARISEHVQRPSDKGIRISLLWAIHGERAGRGTKVAHDTKGKAGDSRDFNPQRDQ